jgi:hypothetical protein
VGVFAVTVLLRPNSAVCRVSRATIAFLENDRADAPRAGDAYGDVPMVRSGSILAGVHDRFRAQAWLRSDVSRKASRA